MRNCKRYLSFSIAKISSHQKLQHHLDGEDDAEHQVADLDGLGEPVRLVVVLDAHAEGVDEDAEEDEALKDVVVHEPLDVHLNGRKELPDAVEASVKPEEEEDCFFRGFEACISQQVNAAAKL